jgi:fructose-bisphosphate aldolase, class II
VALAPTAELVRAAVEAGTGVAAVNVITLEHAEAICAAADRTARPVILQISEDTIRFRQSAAAPLTAFCRELAMATTQPIALHLDHITDWRLLEWAPGQVSSIMYDASQLDYRANAEATRRAADWAHRHGLFVEAELGEVGGKNDAHAAGASTDPKQAGAFVAATGVDALAVAVGSSHAMATRSAELDLDLVARLKAAVPTPLVLHGSSGVTEDSLRGAIAAGITKINVGTALNGSYMSSIRAVLTETETIDPRPMLTAAREAMTQVTGELLLLISTTTTSAR